MFLHIVLNQLRGRPIISHMLILFYPLYYDIMSLTSLKITQTFHLFLGFAENQIVIWVFKIKNSIWITEGLDNGDSDNQGSVFDYHYVHSVSFCIVVKWL